MISNCYDQRTENHDVQWTIMCYDNLSELFSCEKNDLNKHICNLGIYNSLYPLYIRFLIWAKQYFVRKADWE